MESTAQYWKPVWGTLERYWKPICQTREGALATSGTLHLAQALSNRGRRGRKKDFRDAERLVKRLVAHELILSFVPDVEQRLWRTVVRTKYQLTRNRVQLQNRLEAARRMLEAIAGGETNRETLAALADRGLRANAGAVTRRARRVPRVEPGIPEANQFKRSRDLCSAVRAAGGGSAY